MNTSSNSEARSAAVKRSVSSRILSAVKNVALFVIVFLLCITIAEVILRWQGYGNVEIYEPDSKVYWRLRPNQNCFTKIDRKPVHVNAHGTRGREFQENKPNNTIRIVCLGDSRTFGWGLSDNETYPALLEKHLQTQIGTGQAVEVINAGVNAWSYPQMYVYFREFALKWDPDMVILGGANLWTQFSEDSSSAFVKSFMRRVWLKNFLRRFALYHYVVEVQLRDFYATQRTKFIPVDPKQDQLFKDQQKSDPDAFFRKAIEDLCVTASSNKVQTVLIYIPTQDTLLHTNAVTAGVLRAKQQVSVKFAVPLLDLTPDLQPEAAKLFLEADPVHLNVAGNEIIGRRLAEVVSPLLKR